MAFQVDSNVIYGLNLVESTEFVGSGVEITCHGRHNEMCYALDSARQKARIFHSREPLIAGKVNS